MKVRQAKPLPSSTSCPGATPQSQNEVFLSSNEFYLLIQLSDIWICVCRHCRQQIARGNDGCHHIPTILNNGASHCLWQMMIPNTYHPLCTAGRSEDSWTQDPVITRLDNVKIYCLTLRSTFPRECVTEEQNQSGTGCSKSQLWPWDPSGTTKCQIQFSPTRLMQCKQSRLAQGYGRKL